MNSKERVEAILHGKKADRIPRFLWIGAAAQQQLAQYLGKSLEDTEKFIGNDVKQTWLSINREMERPWPQGECFTDEWGICWKRDGYYNMVIKHPMAEMTAEEIRNYPVPDPLDEQRYWELDFLIARYGQEYFIGADISGTIFEPAYHLRGMENLLVDMAAGEEEADLILDMTAKQSVAIAREALKRPVDWIWLGDDVGTQKGMLLSPELWRTYLKPRLHTVIQEIRKIRPDMVIAYHSCGSIRPILKDLEEIGISVINPVQESSYQMDQGEIREILEPHTVMFCGLDTQTFLRTANPEQVTEEMRERIQMLSRYGNYLAGVSHTVQPDIPCENLVAMIETLNMYKA